MRSLSDQVVVVTGASSGIGRAAAVALAGRGARVVLAARNSAALEAVAEEIRAQGGQALEVPTDVSEWDQVQQLAARAVERFRRIDTWVNCAAVTVFGRIEDMAVDDIERVVRVNLMGYVHGMKAALPHLTQGGTIINVSSISGIRPVPLNGPYAASKAGLRAFGDVLRMELNHDGRPVHVTTISPGPIDTPFFEHARSCFPFRPRPPGTVFAVDTVVESIVFAAEHPRRDIVVGGPSKLLALLERVSPSLVDRLMLGPREMFDRQRSDEKPGPDILYQPSPDAGAISGGFDAVPRSLYTRWFEHHPVLRRTALGSIALVGALSAAGVLKGAVLAPVLRAAGRTDRAASGRPFSDG